MRKTVPAALGLVSSVLLGLLVAPPAAQALDPQAPAQAAGPTSSAQIAAVAQAAPPFSDVPASNKFAGDIDWLAGIGVTGGFSDGTFKPTKSVERQAMAAFIYRLVNPGKADPSCTSSPYRDVSVSHPFCGVISWAKDKGITAGYPDGSFQPAGAVSREAAAAFLFRAAGLAGSATACTTKPFPDVSIGSQFCPAITWAAGAGLLTGWEDGTFRPAEPVQRQAMAAFFHRFDDKLIIPPVLDGTVGLTTGLDPYYPEAGNGGHDVTSYDIDLTYTPTTKSMVATATIVSKVIEPTKLGRFSLDLEQAMTVSGVKVNNRAATFVHANRELVITPNGGLAPNSTFTVVVSYSGVPGFVPDVYGDSGWHALTGGVGVVAGEPASSSAWYPSNATPADRALFAVTATVPTGWKAIANGHQVTTGLPTPPEGWDTFRWKANEPMATYLSTLYIDKFTTTTTTTPGGIEIINAFAPGVSTTVQTNAARTEEIIDFLASKFGPYPFSASGGIYLNSSIGYALETQTRAVYSRNPGLTTIVHELAHQWYGDSVTLNKWADICLNECFAAYSEWMWSEAKSAVNLDARFTTTVNSNVAKPAYWALPLVDTGAGHEFDSAVYARGALAMHALRRELGETMFSTLLKRWASEKADKNVDFSDLEAMVTQVAGRDMQPFMTAWFRSTVVPPAQFLRPGTLGQT